MSGPAKTTYLSHDGAQLNTDSLFSYFFGRSLLACALCTALLFSVSGCDKELDPDTPEPAAGSQNDDDTEPATPNTASAVNPVAEGSVRFASYNVSFYRDQIGGLIEELQTGDSDVVCKITEVIQMTRPDVLLLNEFDYDEEGEAAALYQKNYLAVSQAGNEPIEYEYSYFAPVNTGIDSGLDLDGNGETGTPNDAFGFGKHPGQYGMLILSRHEIETDNVRTFQNFLWKDMPDAMWPETTDGESYYSDEIKEIFRLSSKSHWDVPVNIGEDNVVHFLVSHPTPPVFDGPEDRNGCRNHDEIRLFADYVSGRADYLYDDKGGGGGLAGDARFVIAGDLNADPNDGDSRENAARLLTENSAVNSTAPVSTGGQHYAEVAGGGNASHSGDPAEDTSAWRNGHMRVDYCMPSASLSVTASGVFWPLPDEAGADAVTATDHRMVWVDIEK
ncbi:MAG: endonuclease/exonuclease/phosphatase family protein [Planctomycetota bacterium]